MMELLGAIATIAVGILAAVQWNISRKTDARNREVDERYRKAEQEARERERDTDSQWTKVRTSTKNQAVVTQMG